VGRGGTESSCVLRYSEMRPSLRGKEGTKITNFQKTLLGESGKNFLKTKGGRRLLSRVKELVISKEGKKGLDRSLSGSKRRKRSRKKKRKNECAEKKKGEMRRSRKLNK